MDTRTGKEDLANFLDRKGAIGILLVIDEKEGTIHSNFKQQLHISRATTSNLLREAESLDLVELSRHADDHANAKRYVLTEMGRVLRVALESMGLSEKYQQYVELQRELDQSTEDMVEWIDETHDLWNQTKLGEFEFTEEYQSEDTFPGDDVPDGFISFIEQDLSQIEKLKRVQNRKEKDASSTGDLENPPEWMADDDSNR